MPGQKTRSFGSLRRLPSGRWQARYHGSDGLMRTAPFTFPLKRDGARSLALTEAEMLSGAWLDPEAGRVPFTDYAQVWIEERPGLRPKTIQLYRYLLRRHIALGFTAVGTITDADVRRWRADLLAAGVSPVTTAKAYRLLKAILATAVEDGLIRRNPCRLKGAGNEPSPERPLLTIAQVYSLADACGPRYYAMILLACFRGLRWGELVALRRRDIDIDTATVRITRQLTEVNGQAPFFAPPKTAAGRRVVIVPAPVLPAVEDHLTAHALPGLDGQALQKPWWPAVPPQRLPEPRLDSRRHRYRSKGSALPRPQARWEQLGRRGGSQPSRIDGTHGARQQPGRTHLSALDPRPTARARRRNRGADHK
jgi:integrase